MNVYILDDGATVPGVVTSGYVLKLGRDKYELIFLCDGATYAEALRFQQQFLRKTNWVIREQPMNIAMYDQVMRTRHGDDVKPDVQLIEHRRRHL